MALMNNHMPKVQDMQVKFNKARRRGDMVEGIIAVAVLSLVSWLLTKLIGYIQCYNVAQVSDD